MRVALVSPPFISVPPPQYGGTELFVAQLACGLQERGVEVIVYTNGESDLPVETRWLYPRSNWPITGETLDSLKDMNHSSWAIQDAAACCDLIHINNAPGIVFKRYVPTPFVCTLHHPKEPLLSDLYSYFPDVHYVCISDFQREEHGLLNARTIHHGIDSGKYHCGNGNREYLSFLGRMAPMKAPHLAIDVAKKAGIPLKLAGEVQPVFQSYFDSMVKPHIDGKFIEYIGTADLKAKNQLLGGSLALLFPIQWNEPFGLVMIEAMACGTPVLALPGGSVPEVIRDGISGYICRSVDDMARIAQKLAIPPSLPRKYVELNFSVAKMVDEYLACYSDAIGATAESLPVSGEPTGFATGGSTAA